MTADVRWRVRRALGRMGSQAVAALVQALQEERDPAVREFAVDALAQLGAGTPSVVPALRCAARADASATVRLAAERALAAMGVAGRR